GPPRRQPARRELSRSPAGKGPPRRQQRRRDGRAARRPRRGGGRDRLRGMPAERGRHPLLHAPAGPRPRLTAPAAPGLRRMSQSAKDRILAALVPDEIVDLAKALVRIPSYTTEETPVARFLDEL